MTETARPKPGVAVRITEVALILQNMNIKTKEATESIAPIKDVTDVIFCIFLILIKPVTEKRNENCSRDSSNQSK